MYEAGLALYEYHIWSSRRLLGQYHFNHTSFVPSSLSTQTSDICLPSCSIISFDPYTIQGVVPAYLPNILRIIGELDRCIGPIEELTVVRIEVSSLVIEHPACQTFRT